LTDALHAFSFPVSERPAAISDRRALLGPDYQQGASRLRPTVSLVAPW